MSSFLRFLFLLLLKTLSRAFFYFKVEWVGHKPRRPFKNIHFVILLNHTSLFEPIFMGVTPMSWLFEVARRGAFPGADLTLNRPIVGKIFKAMAPNAVTVTRRRDSSWAKFLSTIDRNTMVMLFPEGRMKRPSGLDKHGKPMSVRGGVAEVLGMLDKGDILIIYSGGLHHIQAPGQGFPNLFKEACVRFEVIPIARYKESMDYPSKDFTRRVTADLERRRDEHCRWEVKTA